MKVTPVPHELDLQKSELVRSPGLHASDIYSDLFKELDPKRYDYDGPPNAVLMALGTAWEVQFEELLRLNDIDACRPGELVSPEGIAYSPDLIICNGRTRVGEIKLTSMSLDDIPDTPSNNLPPKFDKYQAQIMLYAYWLDLMYGWLAICSIRKPYDPVLRVFDLDYTERELQENYRMMMNHARSKGML